jgi:glucose-1-phosphate cytidylyltransferase
MKVVILCGGKGTRMGNDELPKPLFPVGGKPILWHIMKIYAHFGFRDFVLCLGYKGAKIREYFSQNAVRGWKVECVDTGLDTNTGGRIHKVKDRIKDDTFLATYGDGLADIDLDALVNLHAAHRRMATITAVRPASPFGVIGIDAHSNVVTHFDEKPVSDHWINGGFFVFDRAVFSLIREGDILEKDSFSRILSRRQLNAYKHYGFWECMDTYKDNLHLNQLWAGGKAPWAFKKGFSGE